MKKLKEKLNSRRKRTGNVSRPVMLHIIMRILQVGSREPEISVRRGKVHPPIPARSGARRTPRHVRKDREEKDGDIRKVATIEVDPRNNPFHNGLVKEKERKRKENKAQTKKKMALLGKLLQELLNDDLCSTILPSICE